MVNLASALSELGFTEAPQQRALAKLILFSGGEKSISPKGTVPGDFLTKAFLQDGKRFPTADAAKDWVKDVTQALFFSPQDYSSIKGSSGFYGQHRETILPLLDEAGLTAARLPRRSEYDFLLIPGGNQPWAEARLNEMEHQLSQGGIRAKHMVLLGSNRLLMPELEKEPLVEMLGKRLYGKQPRAEQLEHLSSAIDTATANPILGDIEDIYARNAAQTKDILHQIGLGFGDWPTEAGMLEHLFDKRKATNPSLFEGMTVQTVNSPMIDRKTGEPVAENNEANIQRLLNDELRRANTHDTFLGFRALDIAQQGGSVLSISHQPYALHQHGQLLAALPDAQFPAAETAAKHCPPEQTNVHHALGSLAKYIYAVRDIPAPAQTRQQQNAHSR